MAILHDFELDVRGEACPYPLIRTKQQVDKLQKPLTNRAVEGAATDGAPAILYSRNY